MFCNGVLSHTPWWVLWAWSLLVVFLGWIRKQFPAKIFGTTHKLFRPLPMYLTLLACIRQDRASKGLVFRCSGAPCISLCPWWGKHGGVKEEGRPWQHEDPLWSQWHRAQPCRGDPKAWRRNKDPPIRLHGKALYITATTRTMLGKIAWELQRRWEKGRTWEAKVI